MRLFYKQYLIFFVLLTYIFPSIGIAQGKPKAYFKEGKILRKESNSTKLQEVTVTIVVPKDKDSSDKSAIAIQDSLRKGKIFISFNKDKSTVDQANVRLPLSTESEFELDSLSEKKEFKYSLLVPRDQKDDKTVILTLSAKSQSKNEIKDLNQEITILLKPITSDTLTTNGIFESWIMTGTNFDFFDGIKAQELFFRWNTQLKIKGNLYGQVAFYKNRYSSYDTSSGSLPYTNVRRPDIGGVNYIVTAGNYRRTTKQVIDPLAAQLDIMYKLTDDSVNNFFVTAGLDYSTTSVKLNNEYDILDTTFYLQTTRPDTLRGVGTTVFPPSINYKKPAYNLSVGFMWILNTDDLNLKFHVTAGLSRYTNLISYYQSRGSGIIYNFEAAHNIYLQGRLFATVKPVGISLGGEFFFRQNEVPTFNFFLAKTFDLRGFIKNFTPVSALKL